MPYFLTEQENRMGDFPYESQAYSEYCGDLSSKALNNLCRRDKSPYEAEYRNSVADTVFSLALVLATIPDRLKNEKPKPEPYYDVRMSLEDYLDSLIDISINEDGTADTARAEQYRRLKAEFSESYDLSKPFCKAVGSILEEYCEPRTELDRVSHIIECSFNAKCYKQEMEMREEYLENEYFYSNFENDTSSQEEFAEITPVETEEFDMGEIFEINALRNEIKTDPKGYFLSVAKELPKNKMLDFENEEYHLGCRTDTLLLLFEDYSPAALKAKADKEELNPAFRKLVDELVTEESVSNAFGKIDAVISKLYRLLVEPFVELGKYHFERHLADEI